MGMRKPAMLSGEDRKQISRLYRHAAQAQIAHACLLRDEVKRLWRESNEARALGDVGVARHFAKTAGAKNELLQQALSLLPYEERIETANVRFVERIALALQRGDEETADLVRIWPRRCCACLGLCVAMTLN